MSLNKSQILTVFSRNGWCLIACVAGFACSTASAQSPSLPPEPGKAHVYPVPTGAGFSAPRSIVVQPMPALAETAPVRSHSENHTESVRAEQVQVSPQCAGCGGCSACGQGRYCHRMRLLDRMKHKWHTETKPHLQYKYWGYLPNFEARPLGFSVYHSVGVQITHAQEAMLTLYQYDFIPEQAELSPHGEKRLRELSHRFNECPWPFVVESIIDDSELSAARRDYVQEALSEIVGSPIDSEQVVLGDPVPIGTRGNDAVLTYKNLLQRIESGEVLQQSQGSFRPQGSSR